MRRHSLRASRTYANKRPKMHSASWNPTKVYYIKCKDIFENKNSGCLIEVSAGYFEE